MELGFNGKKVTNDAKGTKPKKNKIIGFEP